MGSHIEIVNAEENNLRGLNVRIPREALVVVTGVSGSGKSSLAYDTLFQEGQRKYIESLSAYARQFIGQMKRPALEHIAGISPAISIDQKTVNRNPRSTVGTVTGIFDFVRLMFARLGAPYCPGCGDRIQAQTVEQIAEALLQHCRDCRAFIMAPVVHDRKGEYRREQEDLRRKGFVRARIDGELVRLDEAAPLARYEKHTLEAVIDRLDILEKNMPRIREAIETATGLTGSLISVLLSRPGGFRSRPAMPGARRAGKEVYVLLSTEMACPKCGISLPELEPRLFSFNNPQGACPDCDGLGIKQTFASDLIVPDKSLSIAHGAIKSITENGNVMFSRYGLQELRILGDTYGFSLDTPWRELGRKAQQIVLFGSAQELRFTLVRERKWRRTVSHEHRRIRGVIEVMQRVWNRWHIPMLEKYMRMTPCPACKGARLSPAGLAVRFRGKNILDINRMTVRAAHRYFKGIKLSQGQLQMGRDIIKEILDRLHFLDSVGLGYLSLDRSAASLSGGEGQRIRLASQAGAGLQGVLYVLDEPTIGLHASDNRRLLQTLQALKGLGNSLLVVEHDEETIRAADYLIDMGPGAGVRGGDIIAEGTPAAIRRNGQSLTGQYLAGRRRIALPGYRRRGSGNRLEIKGATANNLKNIDIKIPLGMFVCVTGVSGSGKSTLIDFVLKRAVAAHLYGKTEKPGPHKKLSGLSHLDRLVEINQSPIGRTPRSNPVTYTKVFDFIRTLFAELPESKIRGYPKGRFSFNVAGGRCETCGGAGVRVIDMQLLADVVVPCEDCRGRRFNDATLEVHFRGKNIHDVLELTIEEALNFFEALPRIRRGLEMLNRIGLGYVKLGQPSTTLSGGEAQRIKLAAELQKPGTGKTLYLLDEPTTGLHFQDVERLLTALHSLVEAGNTLVVIEHNLDVVKVADHVIDLGPGGGAAGGRVLAQGTPEALTRSARSLTGRALKPVLNIDRAAPAPKKSPAGAKTHGRDIVIKGACKHNLKNITVKIPHHKLTVITGVSGSGKSSLAFGTVFAEGQRRFVESLSTYARRFLGRLDKGDVERIDGLAPAIAVDQKTAGRSSKSTVATITEIYDYFRLLYARLGVLHCPQCGLTLERNTVAGIVKSLIRSARGQMAVILAPLYLPGLKHDFFLNSALRLQGATSQLKVQGYRKVFINEQEHAITSLPKMKAKDSVYLLMDKVLLRRGNEGRLSEALEMAFQKGHGIVEVRHENGVKRFFSEMPYCPVGHFFLNEAVEPRNFSFNSHWGACGRCAGRGKVRSISLEKLVANPKRPILGTGVGGMPGRTIRRRGGYYHTLILALLESWGLGASASFNDLTPNQQKMFLYGIEEPLGIVRRRRRSTSEYNASWRGLAPMAEKWYEQRQNKSWQEEKAVVMTEVTCPDCSGTRLQKPFDGVTIGNKNIGQLSAMTVEEVLAFFKAIRFSSRERPVSQQIMREIRGRLAFLHAVGLGYLALDRTGASLSGGESQRIRLAGQVGSGLEGVLYVLDEPTVGLHQRDTRQLVKTLYALRDLGNTVVVVEHDTEMIRSADWVIDMGPGAGEHGGEIVAQGPPGKIARNPVSLTGQFLSGSRHLDFFQTQYANTQPIVEIRGARLHNLKNLTIQFPGKALITCCGVSGSGKSSLVMEVLADGVQACLNHRPVPDRLCSGISLNPDISQLIIVDQSPLGANPRSCPATYGKIFDKIRVLFASLPDAKVKGFAKSRFSMNTGNGRCRACEGIGAVKKEMHFLSDVWVICDNCRGKRFNTDTLAVLFKGKSISDVLDMTVSEACEYFSAHNGIVRYLQMLRDVGLGYLRLGQSAAVLSGGEAQRVKLSAELARQHRRHNLYILDEPTTGMHLADINQLLNVLRRLVAMGHTVVVIEHQPDFIAASDWIIEVGPEGGIEGGRLLYAGTPAGLVQKGRTHTARSLRILKKAR